VTEAERKAINPEYCAKGIQKALRRLGFRMEDDELAAMYGAVSLLLDKPVEEWLFGHKEEGRKQE